MKTLLSALLVLMAHSYLTAQVTNEKYDENLAKSLNADDYGMKSYILVILKTGAFRTDNSQLADSLFRGHLDNIGRLAEDGKLVVAGPLGKNENNYRGIFILNVATIEEAGELILTDPAVKAGLLGAELYQWYGSAALPEYLKVHEKIEKFKP